ncbi:MAG: hypothetical protein Barrevirus1_39 [Barrevirus sp.]|uniref:Calcineurin-like phosphoesterase domain-containing protein n=1 Tax=Barrevirus sp. TaxID=2487763 RepID=A0A3G4ZPK4_9VIRU|nr:MAG: hypothetical protein Barrevirus1_39 [Barrevirus sp.]
MKTIKTVHWYFPPTISKGKEPRHKYGRITISLLQTDLFNNVPTVAMSDIHSQTPELVVMLSDLLNLDKFTIISCGDMAGNYVRGSDGNPISEYQYLNDRANEFYFVQGNHDLPSKNKLEKKLKNRQGKLCNIQEGTIIESLLGSIGGINGIISDSNHSYKMPGPAFIKLLIQTLEKKPRILLTHDTPSIEAFYESGDRYIGDIDIFKVVDQYKPLIHIYGHCHHPTFYNLINGIHYINVEARVLIFVGPKFNHDALFKKELTEEYSVKAQKLYKELSDNDSDDDLFEK